MDGSIGLKPRDRKVILELYRKSPDPALRLRAHILLLLADGHAWSQIASMLFTSPRTIGRWRQRFEQDGIDAVFGSKRGRPAVLVVWWVAIVVRWIVQKTPRDFSFLRSRWSCGTLVLLVSEPGTRRNAQLFVAHLDDLRQRLRCYRHIHVICDNARFHDCRLVDEFLKRWGHRITIHFLPAYAPQTNPIERVWWHLHEEITRNHRCRSIEELVDLAYEWFGYKDRFGIETSIYPQALAA